MLARGIDPSDQMKLDKIAASVAAANTFNAIAEEWYVKVEKEGLAPATLNKIRWLLDFAYRSFGNRPIAEILPHELLALLRSAKRPMSENTINAALRRLGYAQDEMTGHGFRAMASILLNEMGKWNPDAIERQLAHADGNKVRRAYTRGEYWAERVAMMQDWSDYLDQLRDGVTIIQAKFGRA